MGERRLRRSRRLVLSDQECPHASAIASHHQAMEEDHACIGLERANGSRVAMHTDADGESFLSPEAFLLIDKACAIGPVGWRRLPKTVVLVQLAFHVVFDIDFPLVAHVTRDREHW